MRVSQPGRRPVLLGIRDDSTVLSVNPDAVSKLVKNIVASANDPDKLSPIYRLFPETVEIEGKLALLVPIAQSSQVHCTNRTIYDRSADGDFRVTGQEATACCTSVRLFFPLKAGLFLIWNWLIFGLICWRRRGRWPPSGRMVSTFRIA